MAIDWSKVANKQAELANKSADFGERAFITWFRPQAGETTIRILPGWEEDEGGFFYGQYWREVGQHWNLNPDQKAPVMCPEHTPKLGGSCRVCDIVRKLKENKGSLAAQERYSRVRASTSYLMNIVNLEDPEWTARDVARFKKDNPESEVPFKAGTTKVQVFAAGPSVFNQLLTQMATNHLDISDPVLGKDVVINKTGKGLNTRYAVTLLIKDSAAPEYEELTDLENVGFVMTDDQLVELLASSDLASLAEDAKVCEHPYVEDDQPVAAFGETSDADDLEARLRRQMAS